MLARLGSTKYDYRERDPRLRRLCDAMFLALEWSVSRIFATLDVGPEPPNTNFGTRPGPDTQIVVEKASRSRHHQRADSACEGLEPSAFKVAEARAL